MARRLARARLHDGDGRALRRARSRVPDRREQRGPDRRLHPARPLPGRRRLLAERDAAPALDAERADGVPGRRGDRLGGRRERGRALAQLLRVRRAARRLGRKVSTHTGVPLCPAQARPAVPARAPALLQPQVLPRVASALPLLRTVDGLSSRWLGVPTRLVAAYASRPLDSLTCLGALAKLVRQRRLVESLPQWDLVD